MFPKRHDLLRTAWLLLLATVLLGSIAKLSSRFWTGTEPDRHSLATVEKANPSAAADVLTRPRSILPTPHFHEHIHLSRLGIILDRMRPLSPKPMISVSVATHALRLWGRKAQFTDGPFVQEGHHRSMWQFSSETMIRILLDAGHFEQMYPKSEPLISASPYGISTRLAIGYFDERPITTWPDCEAHVDKVISVLGEMGIEADYPVRASGHSATVADMLRDSMIRFSWSQELDFTAKAYLLYLNLPAQWSNRYGISVTSDALIRRIADQELGGGSCVGTHQCHVMAVALRADADRPFLSPDLRQYLSERLGFVCRQLEQCQLADGGWPCDWTQSGKPIALAIAEGELNTRLRVTGHHLEWIAIAPNAVRPADKCVIRAIEYLQRRMLDLPPDSYYHNYTLLTHAARALVLLSGREPVEVLSSKSRSGVKDVEEP